MAIPLVAGIAIGSGVAGGVLGSVLGGSIDTERERLESLVSEYLTAANEIQEQYNNFSSITDIINKDVLGKKKGIGIEDTYITDLPMAFTTPEQFNFLAKNEDFEGVA